ncbi:glycine--tRNA ligase, putative [Plasmodium knowlesi strain H]|uniref:glycine--tRNA ligase n=3 Tax=Plasmodium knowlesi TaxID=5850 RepID=A0A5K1US42_PLAKH|nr:glycine--tRNA ligase, putative [Plasmodium knowlesi strain H]OTN67743.1 putative Glycine--tRNA ligase [Plasmodium knowlesi]CAA9990406.1 glycine--tRNA ligase, putative [Plasmodium knowlesi strain H]SBO19612.1 glycine--tRNA ligase, putative [Plasmodium knowlesi strain H]SBO22604.1 glycine--tRNA ligase, putative [Plasmodium knowlesi strain H]VVS79880.1 glycine--tRNA ligase, putative [Plasmodium knowlesi strain H]|eukprot:XP_002260806.1 glycyl-tRNA synthetase, putative [Plasmodium knowlesi strain H]
MRLLGTLLILVPLQVKARSDVLSRVNSKLPRATLSTVRAKRPTRATYIVHRLVPRERKTRYYSLVSRKVSAHLRSAPLESMKQSHVEASGSGAAEVTPIEEQIERCSQEISTLVERNECIRGINDEVFKKEYDENEKSLEEKKRKLKFLYSVPSESLNLVNNRTKIDNLAKRKLFYTNSFEIYGGSSGLIDYGPSGCLLKSELENLWRYHFIFYDEMLEISATCITPYTVLKTSGHVDRFTDLMIRDAVTGDFYRADKYIAEYLTNRVEEGKKKPNNTVKRIEQDEGSMDKRDNQMDDAEQMMAVVRRLDGMNEQEIKGIMKQYDIKSPGKNDFVGPFPFNLMFQTRIGPKEDVENNNAQRGKSNESSTHAETNHLNNIAFLRPETAQGIFVNFKKLLEYNGGKMPFAGAQIGLGFRNEISPRNGLLRVREFEMAEIEYFVNPEKKCHEKYHLFKHLILPLYPREEQLASGEHSRVVYMEIEEAVTKGIIANEALAYFLARTYLFLLKCGINKDGLRFRQHLPTEMAHYANDCWDAEILTSYGFIEVVGHADRSAYDLKNHMKVTGANLYACEKYDTPVEEEHIKISPNKAKMGMKFKSQQNVIYQWLNERTKEELLSIDEELNRKNSYVVNIEGSGASSTPMSFELTRDMIKFDKYKKKVQERNFIPNVIEPSFGIGRLIFCIIEHSFRTRTFTDDKEERHYLSLPYTLAPIKCSVLTISNHKTFIPFVKQVQMILNEFSISSKIDNSSVSIGKKYARTDEIGIPFAVTIDFQTLKDKTVTLRERDSMLQVRIDLSDLVEIVTSLLRQKKTWADYVAQYGLFTQQNLDP